MLLLLEVGRRVALHRQAQDPKGAQASFGAIEGAVLSLLGLLLAFTVTAAGTRFDHRRDLIVEETNNIGTAYLRLDMLPEAAQPALRESFRNYVDARLAAYGKLPDIAAANEELARANRLQAEIWRKAVVAVGAKGASSQSALLLMPALNAMIDITTTRTMATEMHPPPVIFILLYALALVSALLAGYDIAASRKRSLVHMLCFSFIIAGAIYVILDLEYPRLGLLRVDAFDQALVDLRKTMN